MSSNQVPAKITNPDQKNEQVRLEDEQIYIQAKSHYQNQRFREAIDCLHKIQNLDQKEYLQLGLEIELHFQQNSNEFQNLIINYFMFQGYDNIDTKLIYLIFIKQFYKQLIQVKRNQEIYKKLVNNYYNYEDFLEEFQLYFFQAGIENFNKYLQIQFQVISEIIEKASADQNYGIQNLIKLNNKYKHAVELVNFVITISKIDVLRKRKLQ